MENRFAGAADVSQRRRRRLANDDHNSQSNEQASGSALTPFFEGNAGSCDVDSQLLRRIISPRLWKPLVFLGVLVVSLATLAYRLHTNTATPGTDVLLQSLSGLLLLISAQLAVLIGWIRARSAVDFQGRYRWWKWLGAGQASLAILLLTNTLTDVPQFVTNVLEPVTGQISAARNAVVLVPVLTFCIIVLARVLPDMSRNIWTQGLLISAGLTAVIRLMLIYASANSAIASATLSLLLLSSAFLTFSAMLLHCRFVAYICNDPPRRRTRQSDAPATAVRVSEHDVKQRAPRATIAVVEERRPETPAATSTPTDEQKPSGRKTKSKRRRAA